MSSYSASMAARQRCDAPNSGYQTPTQTHRRPLQHIAVNAITLSPTKRRKQGHLDDVLALSEPLKSDESLHLLARPELQPQNLMCEIFSRLGARELVDKVAPVCHLWREEAHSRELWAVLRKHLRLVDQLVVIDKLVERRSKGKIFKCKRLGSSDQVLLRVINLELTNAGKDDGVPTSFLREAALLARLRHRNVIQFHGAEILGREVAMCTEFVMENFTQFFKRLEAQKSCDFLPEVKGKFRQLLEGVSFMHHQGIMHRNLKPDNVFIDGSGVVKLGDFTTTRMLDIPFRPYTPEDPKERERSGREMRRLWYRAPELILRDEIYGPKVDMWSVGCLLAEAATGKPMFQSDSEIDHLFRVFRVVGTPTFKTWPDALMMKNFSPKFPVFAPFSFAQVARAACCGSAPDQEALVKQANPDRMDIMLNLLGVATNLRADGMYSLSCLLTSPDLRAGADALLASPFFKGGSDEVDTVLTALQEPHELTVKWMESDDASSNEAPSTPKAQCETRVWKDDTPKPCDEDILTYSQNGVDSSSDAFPGVSIPELDRMISSNVAWSILNVMQSQEQDGCTKAELDGNGGGMQQSPAKFSSEERAIMVDFMVGLSTKLSLTDNTLHLATSLADRYLSQQEVINGDLPIVDQMRVIGAACLKVADVFVEQSKEYYKQENIAEYADASSSRVMPAQILACEKNLLASIGFDLHLPTVHWLLQAFIVYARFASRGDIPKTAFFIADLSLLDQDLLVFRPSLRAQCVLVLAAYIVQRSQAGKKQLQASEQLEVLHPRTTQRRESAFRCPLLDYWDAHVRNSTCRKNIAVDTAMCFKAMVRALVVLRREWKGAQLTAVESKHASSTRALNYPEMFPVSKLAKYILPDCQRGLLPE